MPVQERGPVEMAEELRRMAASAGGDTELRVQRLRSRRLVLLDGKDVENSSASREGISARACQDGVWGFASSADLRPASLAQVLRTAQDNARWLHARSRTGGSVAPPGQGQIAAPERNERRPLEEREIHDLLHELDARIARLAPNACQRRVLLLGSETEKALATSGGACAVTQLVCNNLAVMLVTERDGEPFEVMEVYGGRCEIDELLAWGADLESKIAQQSEHLARKAHGVHARAGTHDCILAPQVTAALIHEAIGHPLEGDLVLGGAITAGRIGQGIASPLVTLVDFAHTAFGETCPVPVRLDDEGTAAEDAVLIRDGRLEGYLTDRTTAARLEGRLTGNARAAEPSDVPQPRMRNTTLLPGSSTLEQMIASVRDGYYLVQSGEGRADSTTEFLFSVQLGYEIRDGRLGRALRDTSVSGLGLEVLRSIRQVSDRVEWSASGTCGKNGQMLHVGMGSPAVLCHVHVGGH